MLLSNQMDPSGNKDGCISANVDRNPEAVRINKVQTRFSESEMIGENTINWVFMPERLNASADIRLRGAALGSSVSQVNAMRPVPQRREATKSEATART